MRTPRHRRLTMSQLSELRLGQGTFGSGVRGFGADTGGLGNMADGIAHRILALAGFRTITNIVMAVMFFIEVVGDKPKAALNCSKSATPCLYLRQWQWPFCFWER